MPQFSVVIYDAEFTFSADSTLDLFQQIQDHPLLEEKEFCICHRDHVFRIITPDTGLEQISQHLEVIVANRFLISPQIAVRDWNYIMLHPLPLDVSRLKMIQYDDLNQYCYNFLRTFAPQQTRDWLERWKSIWGLYEPLDQHIIQWTLILMDEWETIPPEWVHFLSSRYECV